MRIRRALGAVTASGLTLLGTVAIAPVAEAAPLKCGTVVRKSITLTHDMTCKQGPALVIAGSNITVDLGGRTLTGALTTVHVGPYDPPGAADGTTEYDVSFSSNPAAGIQLSGSGVLLKGPGTVRHFSAGIHIKKTTGNTVQGVTVDSNIGPAAGTYLGDGILLESASNNTLTGNTVTNNGPFSGIGLFGASKSNTISGNAIEDNNHPELCGAEDQNFTSNGVLVNYCGPNTQNLPVSGARPGTDEKRPPYAVIFQQNMGLRIEGDGPRGTASTDNVATGNTITGSGNHGVLFGSYCYQDDCETPREGVRRNTIDSNTINANGFGSTYGPPNARMFGGTTGGGSGILWFNIAANPPTEEVVTNNTVNENARHGIDVGTGKNNVITGNTFSMNNAATGGGETNNARDGNGYGTNTAPPCDNNTWADNIIGPIQGPSPPNFPVNQACVNGHTPTVTASVQQATAPTAEDKLVGRGRPAA